MATGAGLGKIVLSSDSLASFRAVSKKPSVVRPPVNQCDTFIDAVRNCVALPQCVRDSASSVAGIETSSFDVTYLEFLDEQIELNARGDEWSQRLRSRRAGLADWCDILLIRGHFKIGTDDYYVKVDPTTHAVVYWEHYQNVR